MTGTRRQEYRMERRQPKPTPPGQPRMDVAVYSFAIALNVLLIIVIGGFRTALGSAWAMVMTMLAVLLVALIALPVRHHRGPQPPSRERQQDEGEPLS
jgi:hypothetical protein